MQYTKGSIARVIVIKFENGDSLVAELKKMIKKEKVKTAVMVFLGAIEKGYLVTGPKKAVIPPEPNKVSFDDGWEVMGVGSVFSNPGGPQIHIHASMGKNRKTLTGCVREQSRVFIVIEAILFELTAVKASKSIDPKTGLNLLKILK